MAELISGYSTFADWATDAANAVREKTESTEKIKPCNLPEAIRGIEVGARGDTIEYWLSDTSSTIKFVTEQPITNTVVLQTFSLQEMNSDHMSVYGMHLKKLSSTLYNNFYHMRWLEMDNVSIIGTRQGISLESISFPNCVTISGSSIFMSCPIKKIEFPKCTEIIGDNCFASCSNLNTVILPKCKTIGRYCFRRDFALSKVDAPQVETIGNYAFAECSKLSNVSFPQCTNIDSYAFMYGAIKNASFPLCTYIGEYAFWNCNGLAKVNLPNLSVVADAAFNGCGKLTTVSIPKVTRIVGDAFAGTNIFSLYLSGNSVVTLERTSAFTATPLSYSASSYSSARIYVPSSLLTAYKSATNWAWYSSKIKGY